MKPESVPPEDRKCVRPGSYVKWAGVERDRWELAVGVFCWHPKVGGCVLRSAEIRGGKVILTAALNPRRTEVILLVTRENAHARFARSSPEER